MGIQMYEQKFLIPENPKAAKMAALDPESNSGAHVTSECFYMDDGSVIDEMNIMDGNAVSDITPEWSSSDRTPGV